MTEIKLKLFFEDKIMKSLSSQNGNYVITMCIVKIYNYTR